MRSISVEIVVLFLGILVIICHAETTTKQTLSAKNIRSRRCQKPKNGQHICFCGKNKITYDRLQGEICIKGQVVQKRYTVE